MGGLHRSPHPPIPSRATPALNCLDLFRAPEFFAWGPPCQGSPLTEGEVGSQICPIVGGRPYVIQRRVRRESIGVPCYRCDCQIHVTISYFVHDPSPELWRIYQYHLEKLHEWIVLASKRAALIWLAYASTLVGAASVVVRALEPSTTLLGLVIAFLIGYVSFINLTFAGFMHGSLGHALQAFSLESELNYTRGFAHKALDSTDRSQLTLVQVLTRAFYGVRLMCAQLGSVVVATWYYTLLVGLASALASLLATGNPVLGAALFFASAALYFSIIRRMIKYDFEISLLRRFSTEIEKACNAPTLQAVFSGTPWREIREYLSQKRRASKMR